MIACRTRLFGTAASGAIIGVVWASAVAASPNACAIVTPSEVAAALGVPVGAGEPLVPNDTDSCTWREQGKTKIQAKFVAVSFLAAQTYQMRQIMLKNNTPESGIGDEAYFSNDMGMAPTLTVKKGGTYFEVTASLGHEPSVKGTDAGVDRDKETDRAIARLILKKL
jgi:hypothetical protein